MLLLFKSQPCGEKASIFLQYSNTELLTGHHTVSLNQIYIHCAHSVFFTIEIKNKQKDKFHGLLTPAGSAKM